MSGSPKNTTDFMDLPIGGGVFGGEIRVIDGKRVRVPVIEESQPVAFYIDDGALIEHVDEDGDRWRLGRYADGRWFRQRSYR